MRILIAPDKFKGTLSARAAAGAIARGWSRGRPQDELDLLPASDGGDGFGPVMSELLEAKAQVVRTIDAAQRPIRATWWWQAESRTAVIESANVIGLAMLPPKKFHPFQLDSFGLGEVLRCAARKKARRCILGIGGSATNDAGFGFARSLGWKFWSQSGAAIARWTDLDFLVRIEPPGQPLELAELIVAVDVQNPLLGPRGCSRVYGPQKGLRPQDFAAAERCLKKMAAVAKKFSGKDFANVDGAGAAGGLGFGLMAFAGARVESGFEIFARYSKLKSRIVASDLVVTGEGAIDEQTLMGKGVGRVARMCRERRIPCLAMAGTISRRVDARKLFFAARGLTGITTAREARARPENFLEKLAARMAREWKDSKSLPLTAGAS